MDANDYYGFSTLKDAQFSYDHLKNVYDNSINDYPAEMKWLFLDCAIDSFVILFVWDSIKNNQDLNLDKLLLIIMEGDE
jgi:SUMO ligase MMS21 Smc5/6 complex component